MTARVAFLAALCLASYACARAKPPAPVEAPAPTPPPKTEPAAPRVTELESKWHGTSFGAYLAPKHAWPEEGGSVDVVFHFHAGQMVEREWRHVGLDAVVVSASFGMFSGPYEEAMQDPARFGRMVDEVLASLRKASHSGPLHAGRIALVAFSAGFAAAKRVLAESKYFESIDTVLLLDALHTNYKADHTPDPRGMAPFVHFASEARAGRKLMVITHSSIVPPDYPSSAASTAALLEAVGAAARVEAPRVAEGGMREIYRVDDGGLHVRGFRGETAKDHMDHLALVGELGTAYLAQRWARP